MALALLDDLAKKIVPEILANSHPRPGLFYRKILGVKTPPPKMNSLTANRTPAIRVTSGYLFSIS